MLLIGSVILNEVKDPSVAQVAFALPKLFNPQSILPGPTFGASLARLRQQSCQLRRCHYRNNQ
jgi:hypothetical protein